MKPKPPPTPAEKQTTLRQQIIALFVESSLSAKEISMDIGIPEKDVYPHLEHIQQSSRNEKRRLAISPAACKRCGFVFRKRRRLTKPGKCPVCRGTSIDEPRFSFSE